MLDLRKRDVTKMSAEELEKWIDACINHFNEAASFDVLRQI